MLMYSASLSKKMLVAKLAQMGNFCLAKSDAMWPMAHMATVGASLASIICNCTCHSTIIHHVQLHITHVAHIRAIYNHTQSDTIRHNQIQSHAIR